MGVTMEKMREEKIKDLFKLKENNKRKWFYFTVAMTAVYFATQEILFNKYKDYKTYNIIESLNCVTLSSFLTVCFSKIRKSMKKYQPVLYEI